MQRVLTGTACSSLIRRGHKLEFRLAGLVFILTWFYIQIPVLYIINTIKQLMELFDLHKFKVCTHKLIYNHGKQWKWIIEQNYNNFHFNSLDSVFWLFEERPLDALLGGLQGLFYSALREWVVINLYQRETTTTKTTNNNNNKQCNNVQHINKLNSIESK